MGDLPSIPSSVSRVMEVLDNPRSSSNDLADALAMDQSLTTRILKTVNSAFYGFPRRIETLSQAVTILGYRAVRELVTVTGLFQELDKQASEPGLNRPEFWRHAAGCGLAARVIAERTGTGRGQGIFLAGLLHDIGKVFLDAFLHDEYLEALELAGQKQTSLFEAEMRVLDGANHTDFGYWLAEEWNLPPSLTAAIAFHHDPTLSQDHYTLVCMVHVGNVLTRALEVGFGGDDLVPAVNRQAWSSLHLTPSLLESIVTDFDQRLSEDLPLL